MDSLCFGPSDQIEMFSATVWNGCMSEVRRKIVPDKRSSCIKGSVAKGGPCPSDKKRSSLSRAQFSFVNDSATVVCQVAGSVPRQRLVDERGDLELRRAAALEASAAGGELARCNRVAECPSPTEWQRSGSTGDGASGRRWCCSTARCWHPNDLNAWTTAFVAPPPREQRMTGRSCRMWK